MTDHAATGGQIVCAIRDGGALLGYVAIDSTVGGRARGGLRMLPDIDEAEMRALARAMTLKYGFAGLPQGGAKAGLRADPEASGPERRERLATFARHIAPLLRAGLFAPDSDMGTSADDIRHVLHTAGLSPKRRDGLASRSGYYTALSVFAASRAGARHARIALAGAPVAIEGFGSVGGALARLLADAGARVVAISTRKGAIYDARGLDVARASALAREAGSGVVDLYGGASRLDRAELIELPVVALFPCARHHSVRADNASAVRATMICPGANDPVTADAERRLTERGVLCIPDFVANAGGVLGGTLAFASVGDAAIAAFIEHRFGPRVAWLLGEAARRGVSPRDLAVELALARHAEVQHRAATARSVAVSGALALYRRGWLPGRAAAAAAVRYLDGAMAWPRAAPAAPRRSAAR